MSQLPYINAALTLKKHRQVKQQYQRFLIVGALGFAFDALVFAYFHHVLLWSLLSARLVAFFAAAHFTWLGNRVYTFHDAKRPVTQHIKQWAMYLCSACLLAIPNILLFKGLVSVFPHHPFWQLVALACGVIAGCLSNYTLNRLWVCNTNLTK